MSSVPGVEHVVSKPVDRQHQSYPSLAFEWYAAGRGLGHDPSGAQPTMPTNYMHT